MILLLAQVQVPLVQRKGTDLWAGKLDLSVLPSGKGGWGQIRGPWWMESGRLRRVRGAR